ncbi:unnamed protein product [Prunus armeniaca]|uniref:Uncharacterized protein n=1 Tax=Prunus armeniaca TaxID=36596 RepID=A0A6J5U258_PRUAR|nr:unnamed protein product [Prunus armeniaca]CAB4299011.1 unnamed protein product [Prunus armeniaca]
MAWKGRVCNVVRMKLGRRLWRDCGQRCFEVGARLWAFKPPVAEWRVGEVALQNAALPVIR